MTIRSRKYSLETDNPKIMQFLAQLYFETKSVFNWYPDNFERHIDDEWFPDYVHIWEKTTDSTLPPKIVGLVTVEVENVHFIHIHPKYAFLEDEIIEWIESNFMARKEIHKKPRPFIVSVEGDILLEHTLLKSGFKKFPELYGVLRFRNIEAPIEEISLPDGFSVKTLQKVDYIKYAGAIRRVFGHDFFTPEIVASITKHSFYNPKLDLFIEAPDGTIASFCTFRLDPESRITQLEPMGTHPAFRGLGLGKTLLNEGFRRLKEFNPTLIYIGGAADTPEANHLYDSTGFTEKYSMFLWVKEK